jgi:hypothetical protein
VGRDDEEEGRERVLTLAEQRAPFNFFERERKLQSNKTKCRKRANTLTLEREKQKLPNI